LTGASQLTNGANLSSGYAQPFNGILDEAAYYGTVLSAADIAAHYAAGLDGPLRTYPEEVLADSPLLYWKFDELGLVDEGSSGLNWAGGAGVVTAKSPLLPDDGYAMAGSGSAPIATTTAVPASLVGANVTIEAWVNIPAGNVSGPFVKVGTSANGWAVGVGGTTMDNTGKTLILLSETKAWHPTTHTFTTGIHHVMVVRGAAGAVTAYVDGASVWSGTLNAPIDATGMTGIGGYSARFLSSGVDVDNVAIFASALAGTRATAHYNGGTGDNTAVLADSPVVFLQLDDAAASGPPLDSSGNARHGTHTAGVTIAQPSLLGSGAGKSVAYNGSSAYSAIAYAAWMNAATPTVEVRIKPTAATLVGSQIVAGRWLQSGSRTWLLAINNGKVQVQTVSGVLEGATTLVAGTTYTIGFRSDGTTLDVLLNGAVDATLGGGFGGMAVTTAPLEIARASAANYGNVQVDEFSLHGARLSLARLAIRQSAASAAVSEPEPTGPAATWWNGSSELLASVTWWDGTTEQPVTLSWWDGTTEHAL
jgi:hypothetical protein